MFASGMTYGVGRVGRGERRARGASALGDSAARVVVLLELRRELGGARARRACTVSAEGSGERAGTSALGDSAARVVVLRSCAAGSGYAPGGARAVCGPRAAASCAAVCSAAVRAARVAPTAIATVGLRSARSRTQVARAPGSSGPGP